MENNVNIFDVKANLEANLNQKLQEANVELSDAQKDAVVQTLIDNTVLSTEKLVDLDNFIHYEIPEGEEGPVKSLLINHLLVYVFDGERVVRSHEQDYREYLEDNDLYADEYQYDQFLRDNELVETFPRESYSFVRTAEIGRLYLNALRVREEAQKQLESANRTIESIQPVISENFLPIVSK